MLFQWQINSFCSYCLQVINNSKKGLQLSGGDTLSVHSGVSGSGSHASNLSKRSQLLMKKAAGKAQQAASKSNSIMR